MTDSRKIIGKPQKNLSEIARVIDPFDGAKPHSLGRGRKRRSGSTPAYRQAG